MAGGDHGGQQLSDLLDQLYNQLPLTGRVAQGWHAQLVYLTDAQARRDRASSEFGRDNLQAWLAGPRSQYAPGSRTPNPANQRRINAAYTRERRRVQHADRIRRLKRALAAGLTLEVWPQEGVEEQSHGTLQAEHVFVADWDDIIDAWNAGDIDQLEVIWEDICDERFQYPEPYYHPEYLGIVGTVDLH